jgi:cytochrome c peroxidase
LNRRSRIIAYSVLVVLTLIIGANIFAQSPQTSYRSDQPRLETAACGGQSCEAVARGLGTFLDRDLHKLGGNGRACADCHMPTDNFQLSPANVEARFQLLQFRKRFDRKADDPLFLPIDADDFRVHGEQASDFSNLRRNALIRITFPLPPNIRLFDPATNQPSTEAFVDVWRAVPTVNDVALTGPDGQNPSPRGPNNTGGYQLDSRLATLQEQARGALINHAQVQQLPPAQLLNDLAAFQSVLFTNSRVRALADAIRAGISPLPDPDPPLNSLETQGKAVFARACGHCHGGAGQSTTQMPVAFRFHDIATQCPRPVDAATPTRFAFAPCPPQLASNARTFEITLANGAKTRRTSSDPGRALLTGFVGGPPPADDWNKLDVPGLRGIRNTAPYFHNNSAATLEEVVDHYIQFFSFVKATSPLNVVPPVASTDGVNWDRQPRPEERAALLAYLRKL